MPRSESLTEVTITSVTDFLNDRRRWCYRWVENRVPRSTPSALRVGTAVHTAFERFYSAPETYSSPGYALEHLLPTSVEIAQTRDPEQAKAYAMIQNLIEPLYHWRDRYPIQATLETEQPFEFFLTSGAKFRGRPDRVVLVNGSVFDFQHKTLAAQANLDNYLVLAQRNLHELVYGWYLARKYREYPYGGSIYNVIRKLQYRTKARGKENAIMHTVGEMLSQHMIGINPALQEQAMEDLNYISIEMDRTIEAYLTGRPVPSNRSLDSYKYGKEIDLYTYVEMGEIDLADDQYFTDRIDTYETVEESE